MIHPVVTVGFEAEWAANIQAMLLCLNNDGHLPDAELHSYHCDCDTCVDMEDYVLKAQRDSTCAGEIISAVHTMSRWSDITSSLSVLEAAAYETDAEPGINAGFHVHARHPNLYLRRDTPDEHSFRTFIGTLMFYPVLLTLGSGRHLGFGFNNVPTTEVLYRACSYMSMDEDIPANLNRWAEWYSNEEFFTSGQADAWGHITGHDRHSFINWRTRYDTIEFRLFRSTRMAWRMELYILLAALSVSPKFSDYIIAYMRDANMTEADWLNAEWCMPFLNDMPNEVTIPTQPLLLNHLRDLCQVQYDYVTTTTDVPATFAI